MAFGGMLLSMNEGVCFKFTKEERVTGEKRIETLFTQGRSFMAYPFRVVFLETAHSRAMPLSVLISIPKKRLKSAVHRNRMKRLVREAYRLNKHLIEDALLRKEGYIDVAFIYVKDELSDFDTVEKGIVKAIRELGRINQPTTA
jgi:ribonuclease P protein component